MARGGRRMKLEEENVRRALIEAIAGGTPAKTACEAVGISADALYDTLDKAEGDGAPEWVYQFADDYSKARASFQQRHLQNIEKASEKTWPASAWLLERTSPELYSLRTKVEHSGKVETFALSSPAEIEANLRSILGDEEYNKRHLKQD